MLTTFCCSPIANLVLCAATARTTLVDFKRLFTRSTFFHQLSASPKTLAGIRNMSTPSSSDENVAKKAILRVEAKRRLATLDSKEKTRQSEIVQKKLIAHDAYKNAKKVSVFLSIDDEVQTLPILKHMLDTEKSVFIPRYTTGKNCYMDMVKLNSWADYESMPMTRWNIKQPSLDEARESALEAGGLDLVILPGLAFTRDGQRLGRGKGHYDRFLNNYVSRHGRRPHTIAVAYKELIFDGIPTTDTDFKIDQVISE